MGPKGAEEHHTHGLKGLGAHVCSPAAVAGNTVPAVRVGSAAAPLVQQHVPALRAQKLREQRPRLGPTRVPERVTGWSGSERAMGQCQGRLVKEACGAVGWQQCMCHVLACVPALPSALHVLCPHPWLSTWQLRNSGERKAGPHGDGRDTRCSGIASASSVRTEAAITGMC